MFTAVLSSHTKLLIVVIFSTILNFQSSAQTSTAFELNYYLSQTTGEKSQVTTKLKQAETKSLESLVYDLHPTAYI